VDEEPLGAQGPARGLSRVACPLCGGPMVLRRRDPLARLLGCVLLYAAAFMLLAWLPSLVTGKALAVATLLVAGCVLMRERRSWWCTRCWYSHWGRDAPGGPQAPGRGAEGEQPL